MSVKADEAAKAIREATAAYLAGDADDLRGRLHANAHVLGSDVGENWRGHGRAMEGLGPELEDIRNGRRTVGGNLVDQAQVVEAGEVKVRGDIAWWSYTGEIILQGARETDSSWTVILERDYGETWKIVHSHFSIHRPSPPGK